MLTKIFFTMPIPAAAIIGAASNVGGGFTNMIETDRQNAQSRRWQEKMYQRQTDDNLAFWQMQNEYNAPAQQMQRFRDAGLNPNLIYSQGNPGNAATLSAPQPGTPEFRVSDAGQYIAGAGEHLARMYDMELKQAQTDAARAQAQLIEADVIKRGVETERARFDLGLETDLRSTSVEARKEALRQTKIENQVAVNRDIRESFLNASHLNEALERMKTLQEQRLSMPLERDRIEADTFRIKAQTKLNLKQIDVLLQDETQKILENELRKKGINPNDPMYLRVIGLGLQRLLNDNPNATSGILPNDPTSVVKRLLQYMGF